jgi:NADH:ubiquinone oxidoreductase subunit 2 (subunit N)
MEMGSSIMVNYFELITRKIFVQIKAAQGGREEMNLLKQIIELHCGLIIILTFLIIQDPRLSTTNGNLRISRIIFINLLFSLIYNIITNPGLMGLMIYLGLGILLFIIPNNIDRNYRGGEYKKIIELPIIITISILGLLIIIRSKELFETYLSIELQTIGLIIIAAVKKENSDTLFSTLKYLIFSAIASSLIILGIILIYREIGVNNFIEIEIIKNLKNYP